MLIMQHRDGALVKKPNGEEIAEALFLLGRRPPHLSAELYLYCTRK